MPLPTSPDALRALVLSLLQTQQEKEAEWAERARYIAQQEQAIALRDETIARLESTIANLQRWRFGRRSEKLSPDQISLWEEALDTEIAAMESLLETVLEDSAAVTASRSGEETPITVPARLSRRHPGRMQLPDTLPRVEVHHDPLTCTCGQCGDLLETIGEEISEKLDYIPGHFQVIRHIRPKLVCRPCGTIESPALPAQVIDKGLPTARLVAHVMTAKHVDRLPLYRQETQYLLCVGLKLGSPFPRLEGAKDYAWLPYFSRKRRSRWCCWMWSIVTKWLCLRCCCDSRVVSGFGISKTISCRFSIGWIVGEGVGTLQRMKATSLLNMSVCGR
jgi:transposase